MSLVYIPPGKKYSEIGSVLSFVSPCMVIKEASFLLEGRLPDLEVCRFPTLLQFSLNSVAGQGRGIDDLSRQISQFNS
jgi:hypothetical protein